MAELIFESFDGNQTVVDCNAGENVMELATNNFVGGIIADCGGEMICGTCHGYVDEAVLGLFPPPCDDEQVMIEDGVVDPKPNSRLCCQLVVPEGIEEIAIRLPRSQT